MNISVTHVVVHTPEQVREIIREASAIADDLYEGSAKWDQTFVQACKLLGQRWTFSAQPQALPLQTMAIPGLKGRN